MNKQNGRLISYRTARKLPDYCATVYGFPLADDPLYECLERLKAKKEEHVQEIPFHVLFEYLESICIAAWPKQQMTIMIVFPGATMVMALVACTRPNDNFVPKEEDLKKVANVLAEEGFKDAPGWYWVRE